MKVIRPTPVTSAMLAADSVPENDYPEWAAGTVYAAGDKVIKAATHRIYESVVAANQGNDPAAGDASKWLATGPTNRWAMLDQVVGTTTTATGTIDLTVAPGAVGSLAILDTNAVSVHVTVTVDGVQLYDQTKTTAAGGGVIDDWYDYFTAPAGSLMTLMFLDLPIYQNAQVRAVITGPDPAGPVTVGTLIFGQLVELGITEAGPSVGINDYSRKTTDDFGVTTITERPWSKKLTTRALVETKAVDDIQRRLAALRARAAVWIGEEGYDSLVVYGFWKDFSIDLTVGLDPDTDEGGISYVSLTIEGLI